MTLEDPFPSYIDNSIVAKGNFFEIRKVNDSYPYRLIWSEDMVVTKDLDNMISLVNTIAEELGEIEEELGYLLEPSDYEDYDS